MTAKKSTTRRPVRLTQKLRRKLADMAKAEPEALDLAIRAGDPPPTIMALVLDAAIELDRLAKTLCRPRDLGVLRRFGATRTMKEISFDPERSYSPNHQIKLPKEWHIEYAIPHDLKGRDLHDHLDTGARTALRRLRKAVEAERKKYNTARERRLTLINSVDTLEEVEARWPGASRVRIDLGLGGLPPGNAEPGA